MPEEEQVEATQEEVQEQQTETPEAETQTDTEDKSLLGEKVETDSQEETVEIPEKYEFQLPDGRELDSEFVEQVTPLLKELKIGQDGAQKLADVMIKNQEAQEAKYKDITEGWKNDTIKTLGNDYQKSLSVASKFIDKFGNDNVRQVLNDTGLGNHPEIVQMFIKAGKHFADDPLVTGTTKTNAIPDPERQARKFFKNTKYD